MDGICCVVDERCGDVRDRAQVFDGAREVVQQQPHGQHVDLVITVGAALRTQRLIEAADALRGHVREQDCNRVDAAIASECDGGLVLGQDLLEFKKPLGRGVSRSQR